VDTGLAELLRLLLASGAMLWLPGLAWQAWLPPRGRDWAERAADGLALSLSFWALLALAGFYLGLSAAPEGLRIGLAALAVIAAAGFWFRRVSKPWSAPGFGMLAALAAGGIAWRLFQARGLALPPWVDPLHHGLIVRAVLESGGLPANLSPYLPVPFYYHFSFHITAAGVTALSGLPVEQVLLGFGQVLNGLVGLAVYRLSAAVWRDRRGAALAALLAVFFAYMPGYYLSWGRYTLLAGLLVLGPGLAAVWETTNGPGRAEAAARLALLAAGSLLSHYLTAGLLALGAAAAGISLLAEQLRARAFRWKAFAGLVGGGLAGVLLGLPWLLRVLSFSRPWLRVSAAGLGEGFPEVTGDYIGYLGQLLGPEYQWALWALGLAGLLLALWRGQGRWLAGWGAVIALLCLPRGLRLGPFSPHHYVMVLFLPASVLGGYALVSLIDRLPARAGVWKRALAALLALIAGAAGMYFTRNVVNPVTRLADQADLQALDWIQVSTPADARFLINTTYWQDGWYRGVDGGAWILTRTGRRVIQPPPFFAFGDEDYVRQVTDQAKRASQLTGCDQAFWDLVREAGITHVYVHDGRGSLTARALRRCGGLIPVYAVDGVSLFEVVGDFARQD